MENKAEIWKALPGVTGVACVNTNRNFIGMELEENYFKIAKERIEQARKLSEDKQ